MFEYLRRLATTGFAYTAASILSKVIAVGLLPVYTAYLTPADYGAAEVLLSVVVAISIVVRFGGIEALLRFYYLPAEEPERVAASGFALIFWGSTLVTAATIWFAEPISEALLDQPDAGLTRIAILGIWVLTVHEYLLTLLRVDERARAYFGVTLADTVFSVIVTVILVVPLDMGADGILLGVYAAGLPFTAWLAVTQRRRVALRPDIPLLRRMMRFGLPTMPAELSLYALNVIDRIAIARLAGLAEAGLYAIAFKFSQGIQVLIRGFQLAWPPLAYSIVDDDEARRAYAVIVTWFAVLAAFAVSGLWLEARWIIRIFAAPEYFASYEVLGLLAAGSALYGFYLVLLVVLGRTGRTEFNLPATLAAVAVNVVLNIILIPPLGIVGAGLALVAAYIVVLVMMFRVTQRLFYVPYEWRRLALAVGVAAALTAAGELLLPTDGLDGFVLRAAAWLAYLPILAGLGFATPAERSRARQMARAARERARRSSL